MAGAAVAAFAGVAGKEAALIATILHRVTINTNMCLRIIMIIVHGSLTVYVYTFTDTNIEVAFFRVVALKQSGFDVVLFQ